MNIVGKWKKGMCASVLAGLILAAGTLCAHAEMRAIKSRVAPVYPEIAKRLRVTGVVKLEATVDAEGKVTDVKMLSGNQVFQQSAEDALRKWKFAPGDGTAIVPVSISFDLGQ